MAESRWNESNSIPLESQPPSLPPQGVALGTTRKHRARRASWAAGGDVGRIQALREAMQAGRATSKGNSGIALKPTSNGHALQANHGTNRRFRASDGSIEAEHLLDDAGHHVPKPRSRGNRSGSFARPGLEHE